MYVGLSDIHNIYVVSGEYFCYRGGESRAVHAADAYKDKFRICFHWIVMSTAGKDTSFLRKGQYYLFSLTGKAVWLLGLPNGFALLL